MLVTKAAVAALAAFAPFASAASERNLRALSESRQRELAAGMFSNGNGNGNGKGNGNGGGNGKNPDTEPGPNNPMGTYIVSFHHDAHVGPLAKCDAMSRENGGNGHAKKVFKKAIEGCTVDLPLKAAKALQKNSNVKTIEPDAEVTALQEAFPNPVPWGLDRVNQISSTLDNSGTRMDATDVRVFIIDTGVQGDHNDFAGNMSTDGTCHFSAFTDPNDPNFPYEPNAQDDAHGHGTHVASTTCGRKYGVAYGCEICAVKVLASTGSGSNAGVIAGIEHAMENCPEGQICVANMSLGGGFSSATNQAVLNAHNAGVVVVVAAGNSNTDACNSSPASAAKAVTVGSTQQSGDYRSSFSNYGSCVDVYAPGSGIIAAWPGGADTTNTISGTSMASPHVAGIAAGVVKLYNPANADDVATKIAAHATRVCTGTATTCDPDNGYIDLATTYNMCEGCPTPATPAPTTAPPTPAPTPCVGTDAQVVILTDNYAMETSWTLSTAGAGQVAAGGGYTNSGTTYTTGVCLADGTHTFEITDSYGDGICCSYGIGSYTITGGGTTLAEGGEFTSSETKTFTTGGSAPSPTPPPTVPATPPPTNPPPTPPPTVPATPPPTAATPPPTTLPPTPPPTIATPPPTTAPPAPTPPPSPEAKACVGTLVGVRIVADAFPEETAFEIRDVCSDQVWSHPLAEATASSELFKAYCLRAEARYEFKITDQWGDGLSSGGYYHLYVDTELVKSGSDFAREESHVFGAAECPI